MKPFNHQIRMSACDWSFFVEGERETLTMESEAYDCYDWYLDCLEESLIAILIDPKESSEEDHPSEKSVSG